ncbi:hypothetical protein E4U41_003378 [Claviceps citrina]|nr:hypothetical protein E4U41_003378 [Claviceps citrina]
MSDERLSVIALISGGKDSFYSLLHCIHHGHRIVALANLFPGRAGNGEQDGVRDAGLHVILPEQQAQLPSVLVPGNEEEDVEGDLNSFMYQTVGHEVIPLYAQATGLPLYRRPILGAAVRHERDYDYQSRPSSSSSSSSSPDETESMLSLLKAVQARHPDANALCSGAILSTYQRTRVESVALRLGLTPLSYLWKYPVLPAPQATLADEAQLLRDMAAAGLEARIVKVASAGLEEKHLWERVTSETGVSRIKASLRKFGFAEGASLGEGGEFETIVVDGPDALFRKRISIPENGRLVVSEGGGSTWLRLRGAHLEDKARTDDDDAQLSVREPAMLDARFETVLHSLHGDPGIDAARADELGTSRLGRTSTWTNRHWHEMHRSFVADAHELGTWSIQHETIHVVEKMTAFLSAEGLDPRNVSNVIILLRDMSDFPKVNKEYGQLFQRANPPSRVTVSCGDLLPEGRNMVVHLTVPVAEPVAEGAQAARSGLHVQSRSYWAPANIGPYSQAIETAVTVGGAATTVRTVHVAGQIPLMPASMGLPPPSASMTQRQVVLSLQHLWRIGAEMKVQCWTSAVAYFARQPGQDSIRACAKLAGQAWRLAHGSPDEEDGDGDGDGGGDVAGGPDLWDLKYNAQYQSLGSSSSSSSSGSRPCSAGVPDWSMYTLRQQNEPASCIPPMFTAETESLPRQSLVEWHAHAGIKGVAQGGAELVHHAFSSGTAQWRSWHCVVRTGRHLVLQTTLAHVLHDDDDEDDDEPAAACSSPERQQLGRAYGESLQRLLPDIEAGVGAGAGASASASETAPYLAYVDVSRARGRPAGDLEHLAVVPCRSLWSAGAERLGAVALYKRVLSEL